MRFKSSDYIYKDLIAITKHFSIWILLGSQDIKLRYRRSTLGPFWISLSMAITVYSLGFIYSNLFHVALKDYLPYLASGIICWSFISSLILEGSNAFIESANYIKNQEVFLSLFMMRIFYRNTIILLHNLFVFIPLFFIFDLNLSLKFLFIIPGWLIIGFNLLFWGSLLAIIGTKYRDFGPIVSSIVQIVFFLTPIMWPTYLLSNEYQWIIECNPFNQFLNLIRAPLMNQTMSSSALSIIFIISITGFLLYGCIFEKYKHRIIFWI